MMGRNDEKVTVAFYYVNSDINDEGVKEGNYQEFMDLDQAIEAYAALPNHLDKEIGMESTEKQPSRMALIRCRNGVETLCDIEEESLSGKWVTAETIQAQNRAQFFLDNHDVEIAYHLEKDGKYLEIHTTEEGYDYTLYDGTFHEIEGGIYDDSDIPIEEAMEEILSDAGLSAWPAHRKVMDYSEFSEKVALVGQEEIRKVQDKMARSEALSLISDRTEQMESLNGISMAQIEEIVLDVAQAEIDDMGLENEVKLLGARVYGSRSREGLYTDKSDIDVVLSYSGDISEYEFFNILNEYEISIGGIPLDINPISTEKTGTLEDYLKKAEQYLGEKEAQMKSEKASPQKEEKTGQADLGQKGADKTGKTGLAQTGEKNPVQTEQSMEAEALENMDLSAKNNPVAQPEAAENHADSRITFYVAECMEFPMLGEFHENIPTIQEALTLYEQIPAKRMSGIKGIGFTLYDGSIYDGMEYELMSADKVSRDMVDEIEHYKGSPLVQKALADLETAMQAKNKSQQIAQDSGKVPERKSEPEKPLAASDITELRLISNKYDPASRDKEYTFSCKINGEPDVMTYSLFTHNGEEHFSLLARKHDIWNSMSTRELFDLKYAADCAATFGLLERGISEAKTESDLDFVNYEIWELEQDDMTDEQWNEIYRKMEDKNREMKESGKQKENEIMKVEDKNHIEQNYVDNNPSHSSEVSNAQKMEAKMRKQRKPKL